MPIVEDNRNIYVDCPSGQLSKEEFKEQFYFEKCRIFLR